MTSRVRRVVVGVVVLVTTCCVAGLAVTGATIRWGPFAFLHSWEGEVAAVEQRYDPAERSREILFYGASNFALWTGLEEDLPEYRVQNHAFGGSTDRDLLRYADRLLYPYDPAVVVLQTGSNDYVGSAGSDERRVDAVVARKRELLATIHRSLPDAHVVVLSGVLMPGRSEYTPLIHAVNDELAGLAEELEYVTFVDAESLTWDGTDYLHGRFVDDGIHLTVDARRRWAAEYIRPALAAVVVEHDLHEVRR